MATALKKLKKLFPKKKTKQTTCTSGIVGTEPELDSKETLSKEKNKSKTLSTEKNETKTLSTEKNETKTLSTEKNKTMNSQTVHQDILHGSDVPWEINRDDLLLTRKLADDKFSKTYEGVLRCDRDSSETRVAAKFCFKRYQCGKTFLDDADIIKKLNSHHVVKLIGLLTLQEPFGIVTELIAHGDLQCFLRHHNPEFKENDGRDSLSWMQMLQMCGEIADGMAYLSDMKFVHRHLAARNCFVVEDMTVKIGGLHMAQHASDEICPELDDDCCFFVPVQWMSPETIVCSNLFSMKSDVWSYGVLIWEIATLGRHPYPGLRTIDAVDYILSGQRLAVPEGVNSKMRDLMNMCWKLSPSERPTFSDIIEILEPDLNDKFHKVCYFHRDERNDDFVHDSYALDLYKKALQEGKEEDRSIRVNIVGNFGQGKTSLVRRLVGESIEGVHSTNGIAVNRYECKKEKDGTFSYIRKETLDNSDIGSRLVLVARATTMDQRDKYCKTNFEPLDFEKADLAELQDNLQDTVISDGNTGQEEVCESVSSQQVTNVQRPQSHEEKQKRQYLMGKTGFKIFEENLHSNTYSANDKNIPVSIDIWDFGGQHTFYATHTIFHSRRAIYLLVFNLSVNLQEQAKDEDESEDCFLLSRNRDMAYYLRFWMNSIHSFVGNGDGTDPPVILVGTHKDKLSGNEEDKQCQADKYFCDVRDIIGDKQVINHIRPDDFAIDNTNQSDESIRLLREAILKLGEEKSKTVSVPAKWIQLERALFGKRASRIISLAMVMEMDAENEFPISNIEEIKLFLKYHHNKGTVCYFDEEPISNHVVVDPQYLIDSFKCIITSGIFCRKDTELRDFWQKLLNDAKLEHTLIDTVWGRDKDKEFSKHKSILIAFLKKHHVISEAMRYDPTKQECEELGWFLVPSLLRNHSSETTEINDFLRGKQQSLSRFVLKFENSTVVPTIYHRVVAASLGKWPVAQFQSTNLIYENLLALRLDIYHDGLIEMKNNHIELSVVSLCPSTQVTAVTADKLRRFVESVVEYEFGKLRDVAGEVKKPYVTHLRCNHHSHGLYGSMNLIEILQLTGRKILPCPDSMSHEIIIENTLSEWFQVGESLQNIPRQQLPEKCLSKISRAIGRNWELLGLELGLTDIEIQHIIVDNPTSVVMRIYKMLTKWNKKVADTATMDVLVQAMRNCPEVFVDWDIIRNVIDEII